MNWFKRRKIRYIHITARQGYIEYMPTELTYDEMPVTERSITDEELVIDNTWPKDLSYMVGSVYLALDIGLVYFFWGKPISSSADIVAIVFDILLLLSFLFMGIKYLYRPIRKFTFHRMTGLVDVPIRGFKGWKGATKTIPFEFFHPTRAGWRTFYTSVIYPGSPWMFRPTLFESFDSCNTTGEEVDGFLMWYMDKNRPLPPGKALDPYRMKDYLRREAEGFPEPLYQAVRGIKIPDRKKMPIIKEEQEAKTEQKREEI